MHRANRPAATAFAGLSIFLSITIVASTSVSGPTSRGRANGKGDQGERVQAVYVNPTPIVIDDAPVGDVPPGKGLPYPSPIVVTGVSGVIANVQVSLVGVNHVFPDDMDVLLVSPGGQSFVLQSDAGGNTSAVNKTYTFSDDAASQIPNDGGLLSGSVRPGNYAGNDTNDVFPAPAPPGPYGNPGPQSGSSSTLSGTFFMGVPNGTWNLYVTDDEHQDMGRISGGWVLTLTIMIIDNFPEPPVDFDGDFKSDFAVIRPAGGTTTWYVNRSTAGFFAQGWGASGDVFVPKDYDGDGKCDLAVWREVGGNWYIFQSATSTLRVENFGTLGDDPTVVDDYDGDGKADPAVTRNSGGAKTWYFLQSTNGFAYQVWGLSTDISVPGDYDADGKADVGVKRLNQPSAGLATFYFNRSTSGFEAFGWGNNGDTVAPGDYDGDHKADVAVAHPAGGDLFWFIRLSTGGVLANVRWGLSTDRITQGDYDGDGKTDIAVWRPGNGFFYVSLTGGGNIFSQWGQTGDYPAATFNTH